MSDNVIEVEGLTKRYGAKTAVDADSMMATVEAP